MVHIETLKNITKQLLRYKNVEYRGQYFKLYKKQYILNSYNGPIKDRYHMYNKQSFSEFLRYITPEIEENPWDFNVELDKPIKLNNLIKLGR